MKTQWKKNCPNCNDVQYYSQKWLLTKSIKNNVVCRSCSKHIKSKNTKYFKQCSGCDVIQYYSNKYDMKRAIDKNILCNSCCQKGKTAWNRGLTKEDPRVQKYSRKVGEFNHSKKTKEYLRNLMLGKTYEEIHGYEEAQKIKLKQRLNSLERMDIHKIFFNKNACKYFDWLNMYNGWNGQHAMNGGEKEVLGYFVDYYEPKLNLVIEWDEKYHNTPKQTRKDKIRENEIIKFLNCNFYRIDETTNKMRLVNSE